jgi:predicted amidophosphoribosyltransferase
MRMLQTIRNCTIRPKAACPKQWDDLTPTDSPTTRHCPKCDHDVYFCASDEETLAHARAGHCIAREEPHHAEMGFVIGRMMAAHPPEVVAQQSLVTARRRREHGINVLLGGRLDVPSRPCPDCVYPVPTFRDSCYVCGRVLGRG